MPQYISAFYCTNSIQLLLNIIFIGIAVIHWKKLKKFTLLLIYSLFTLSQSILGFYVNIFEQNNIQKGKLLNNTVKILALIEFIFFIVYITRCFTSKLAKKILISIGSILSIIIVSSWLKYNSISHSFKINFISIESFILIIACLIFYYEFFLIETSSIFKNPIFWSISGIFFLSLLLFPISLQDNYVYLSDRVVTELYSITYIGYIVLFTLFINALRCQIQR
jgi:hypothetical protein